VRLSRFAALLVGIPFFLGACAPSPGTQGSATIEGRSSGPKTITVAIAGAPPVLDGRFNTSSNKPGWNEAALLYSGELTSLDNGAILKPRLAEAAPTTENGNWKVFPDGTMETRVTIKPGAAWHDGTPLTTADLLFTDRVAHDRSLPQAVQTAHMHLDRMEAVDDRTILMHWKQPFIQADRYPSGHALPGHILEKGYDADHQSILSHPYLTTEFVGTGPFKVTSYDPGVAMSLTAFDQYVLGRPKIDQIEVRFIIDLGATMANILAGEIDMTLGRGLSTEQGVQLQNQWRDGRVTYDYKSWLAVYRQYIDPNPPVISTLPFGKGLMHAIDRQEMVDTLNFGYSAVAEISLDLSHPQYNEILNRVPRYPYDPRRAAQYFQDAGYARGGDGVHVNGAGQRLELEIRTTGDLDIQLKSIAAMADYLRRAGMVVTETVIPTLLAGDRPYRVTFPGLQLLRQPYGEDALVGFLHSSRLPTPENGYVGGNNSRYSNREWDALLDRYAMTIPRDERMQALSDVMYHLEDQLPAMSLFYDTQLVLFSNRMANVDARSMLGFNAETWEVK
jgi:peptide/nickel transport system substrate-binding protein